MIKDDEIRLCISEVVHQEISVGPSHVQGFFNSLLAQSELVEIGVEALQLRDAYIDEGILSEKWYDDALHVALATTSGSDLIVSWNFKHIVNFKKIPLFNAVNTLKGYLAIMIYSPLEVINYGE